ncbi:hypothetical protein PM082_021100 [Marasmius tenuissimus]|nr:hypothetical protein PM082_021100 [Marasmius tenuissimus]
MFSDPAMSSTTDPGDQRLNTYKTTYTPKQRSMSDFCYAAAPVLQLFRKQNPQFTYGEMAPFTEKAWDMWYNVWPEAGNRERTATGLEIYVGILTEASHHQQLVDSGSKEQAFVDTTLTWEAALDQSVRGSNFQKWNAGD